MVGAGAVDRVSITGGEPLIVGDFLRLNRLFDTLEQSGLEYDRRRETGVLRHANYLPQSIWRHERKVHVRGREGD